ncbi:lipopolysaccharide 3-alpha-galactosyltransferase [Salmonella enterica subsp. salamae]|nr:lipopolysaccharide 3-alpha-galactosyltransferase [Salmonella enterica subsp. salamae]ECJ2281971.1 lipopolysaccharide 3-alpha-galactosyltransferase [Salmonella enterica subsp. salamae]HCC0888228.1 lipopolysaccharide 3-alpha-galactosyltransferase [Salmonella enterica]HCC0890906.1 lipopolysaccharide 3-alpha-galactosyltransferase [Salmonella enterica]
MSRKYFEEEVIQQTLDYNYAQHSDANKFNIAYGIDKNFLFGCGVSIASILLANPEKALAFHVFTDYFSPEDQQRFDALAKQYATQIVIYLIDCERLKSLPSTKNWTYATYFRFIIADYFSDKADKVLYLDADIACKESIQELIDLNFSAHEIAAVVAEGELEWWTKRSVSLATPGLTSGYFNAGFLLINISRWTAENISKKAIEMLKDPEVVQRITHLDQDVLNILLVNKTRFVDKKFNTQFSINYELKHTVINPVNADTVFIHYIGPTKPWHSWGDYPVSQYFLHAKRNSPWSKSALLSPVTSHQLRYAAKHMFNQKNYISGLRYYLAYFKRKLIE